MCVIKSMKEILYLNFFRFLKFYEHSAACLFVCVPCACLVPADIRRCCISWDWSSGWLLYPCSIGKQTRVHSRATCVVHCGAIIPALKFSVYSFHYSSKCRYPQVCFNFVLLGNQHCSHCCRG